MMLQHSCLGCQKTFSAPHWKNRKYCSLACYSSHHDQYGSNHPRWRGEVRYRTDGRKLVYTPDRPGSSSGRFTLEYILIAEKALGHKLPAGAIVHHVDEDSTNNANNNLVICPDNTYHMLIHYRQKVLRAGGNPNTDRLCCACGIPKPAADFFKRNDRLGGRMSTCKTCVKHRRDLAKGIAA